MTGRLRTPAHLFGCGCAHLDMHPLVRVTVRVVFEPTVSAAVRMCELPLDPVAKFHPTRLAAVLQPACGVDSALVVYPAHVAFVGS